MAPVEKISGVPHPLISTSIIKVVSLGLGFAAQHYHLEELLMEVSRCSPSALRSFVHPTDASSTSSRAAPCVPRRPWSAWW